MEDLTWWSRRLEVMKLRREDFLVRAMKGEVILAHVVGELYIPTIWIQWAERIVNGEPAEKVAADLRKEFEKAIFTEGLPKQHLRTMRRILTTLEEEKTR